MVVSNGKNVFSIKIESYEFPDCKPKGNDFDYDANWLVEKITYTDAEGTREYNEPCLLTCELTDTLKGISAVISGEAPFYISDYLEPYLKIAFMKTDGGFMLGMEFVYETEQWKKHRLSQLLSAEEAQKLTGELKAAALRFPVR